MYYSSCGMGFPKKEVFNYICISDLQMREILYGYLQRMDNLCHIEGFKNWGIEGLKDKTNKLEEIEFLQFLNPSIPEFLN
jgi:hypothetical protein